MPCILAFLSRVPPPTAALRLHPASRTRHLALRIVYPRRWGGALRPLAPGGARSRAMLLPQGPPGLDGMKVSYPSDAPYK